MVEAGTAWKCNKEKGRADDFSFLISTDVAAACGSCPRWQGKCVKISQFELECASIEPGGAESARSQPLPSVTIVKSASILYILSWECKRALK